jgi:hypothetical protein
MFPKAALPHIKLISPGVVRLDYFSPDQSREPRFDGTPAIGVITIAVRHLPNCMEMIRQYHPRFDLKGLPVLNPPDGCTQSVNLFHKYGTSSVLQRDSKKVRSTSDTISAIVNHAYHHLLDFGPSLKEATPDSVALHPGCISTQHRRSAKLCRIKRACQPSQSLYQCSPDAVNVARMQRSGIRDQLTLQSPRPDQYQRLPNQPHKHRFAHTDETSNKATGLPAQQDHV